jgi:hypothetical protein
VNARAALTKLSVQNFSGARITEAADSARIIFRAADS